MLLHSPFPRTPSSRSSNTLQNLDHGPRHGEVSEEFERLLAELGFELWIGDPAL